MSFCVEGDFPESLHRVVYVIINKRSFESFHVFGSYVITLAVILVSDLFCFLMQHNVCSNSRLEVNRTKAFVSGFL